MAWRRKKKPRELIAEDRELVDETREVMGEVRDEIQETREVMQANREFMDGQRQFMHELLLRFDKSIDKHIEESRKERAVILAEIRTNHEREMAEFAEVHAENRAQREALFRMLDKLDGGGAAPATG